MFGQLAVQSLLRTFLGGFYGVVGQRLGQRGLSVAVPGGLGVVLEWSQHSSSFPGQSFHALSQLGPLKREVLPPLLTPSRGGAEES